MDPRGWSIIQQNITYLCNNLIFKEINAHLIQEVLISNDDDERILNETTNTDKIMRLLKILKTKENSYSKLLEVLDKDFGFIKMKLESTAVDAHVLKEEEIIRIMKKVFHEDKDSRVLVSRVGDIIKSECPSIPTRDIHDLIRRLFPAVKLSNTRKSFGGLAERTDSVEICYPNNLNSESEERVLLEDMTTDEVCQFLQLIIEKHDISQEVIDIFRKEEMNGFAFKYLTCEVAKCLLKDYPIGTYIIPILHARDNIIQEEEQLNVTSDRNANHGTPRYRETFRKFDKPTTSKDTYKKGAFLTAGAMTCHDMLEPVHRFCMPPKQTNVLHWLATETAKFCAGCMNDRTNGTIHFGIAGASIDSHRQGEILGLDIDINECRHNLSIAYKETFCPDQIEVALKCIREPEFMPVVSSSKDSSCVHVIEVDVVPRSEIIQGEAVYIRLPIRRKSKKLALYRCAEDTPKQATDEEKIQFMKMMSRIDESRRKQEESITFHIRTDLRAQFLHLLTGGIESFDEGDIYPLIIASPLDCNMDDTYIEEHLRFIKDIGPFAIFDFNPHSDSTGLFRFLEDNVEDVFKVFTTDNFDKTRDKLSKSLEDLRTSVLKPWFFCNGYEAMDLKEMDAHSWKQERSEGYKELLRFYQDHIPDGRARIIFLLFSKNYEVMLEAAEEIFVKFKQQWLVLAEDETIINHWIAELHRRHCVDKKILRERCVIGMSWNHVNQTVKQITKSVLSGECELVTAKGVHCILKKKIQNELCDLDILGCNEVDNTIPKDSDRIEVLRKEQEENFYRGGQVTWLNLWFREDHVLCREVHTNLMYHVHEALKGELGDGRKVGIVELYHQPGAGGTTSAKQVLWELRKCYRCCIIKQITSETPDQIATLRNYEKGSSPVPPIVLIDNEDELKVNSLYASLEESAQKDSGRNGKSFKIYCLLLTCVRRISGGDQREKFVFLKQELKPREEAWFKRKSDELQRKHQNGDGVDPKFLISFNVLKENFNLDYIKRIAGEFVEDIVEGKEKALLKYLSLIGRFDINSHGVPVSSFDPLMNRNATILSFGLVLPGGNTTTHCWETQISHSLKVLLNRTSRPISGLGGQSLKIINYVLAEEILNCLIEQTNTSLGDVMQDFLNEGLFKTKSYSRDQLLKIVLDLLKKRRILEDGNRETFSPMVLEIIKEDQDKVEDIFCTAFKISEDPFLAQQIARFYIYTNNWDQASEYAKNATDICPSNSFLWDTNGRVHKLHVFEKYSRYLETGEEIAPEDGENILEIAFEAIEKFSKAQECSKTENTVHWNSAGFWGEIRTIVLVFNVLMCNHSTDFETLHRFLVDPNFFPDAFAHLSKQTVMKIKSLQQDVNRAIKVLLEEKTQLKKEKFKIFSQNLSINTSKALSHLVEEVDSFLGEETNECQIQLSPKEVCEFRRRRVRRLGGRSLENIFSLRWMNGGVQKLRMMDKLMTMNWESCHRQIFDGVIIMNVRMAMAKCNPPETVNYKEIIEMSQTVFDKINDEIEPPPLEVFLYYVIFNWPTKNKEHMTLSSINHVTTAISNWRDAFDKIHPKPEIGERRDATCFFLGKGKWMDEIVHNSELDLDDTEFGDEIWYNQRVINLLRRVEGTLISRGNEVLVKVKSANGNISSLTIPTSAHVSTKSWWQKRVHFVQGFSWSGPRAFDISIGDLANANEKSAMKTTPNHPYHDVPESHQTSRALFDIVSQLDTLKSRTDTKTNEERGKLKKEKERLLQEQRYLLGGNNQ